MAMEKNGCGPKIEPVEPASETFKYDSHNGHNATWKSSKQLSLHIEGEIECSGHDIPPTIEEICLCIKKKAQKCLPYLW